MVNKNGLSVIAYFFGIIGGIVIYLVTEKKDRYVRFHAIQSILYNIAAGVIWLILAILFLPMGFVTNWAFQPMVGMGIVFSFYSIILFIVWIALMYRAWSGEKFKLPIIGDLAEDWSK